MKKFILLLLAFGLQNAQAQIIDVKATEDFSPYIFGHNLEHTRSALHKGLSAQMLENRKFAGKPQANLGLAAHWFPIGEKVLYLLPNNIAYTKHICLPNMHRENERAAQVVENLIEGQIAGMGQNDLALTEGRAYELRTVTKVNKPVQLKVELTDGSGEKVYASHTLSLTPGEDWVTSGFELTPNSSDTKAAIRYTFKEMAEITFGALSMMPKDNFHGMRRDVVENLKQIGPRLIRWPGGNFAGEYRWKDGLLPADQRAPQQSFREIETQPHSDGYDYHEINTDDFIALCRYVGAEPLLTINLAWQSPEESAQWVEYCNGAADTEYGRQRAERGHPEPYNVHFWSLGNEMGWGHMEGPNTPERYTEYAMRQSEAMLKVTPNLELFTSGLYPNDDWAQKTAAPMASRAKNVSMHGYYGPAAWHGGGMHYTTPEETAATYRAIVGAVTAVNDHINRVRQCLDKTGAKLNISFDEWNQWYAWNRPSCVGEGIFTARMEHLFLNRTNEVNMPVVCYFQPVGEGAIIIDSKDSRLTANGQMFAMMKAHQDGKICRVTENDDFSTAASLHGDTLVITLINAEYDRERTFTFPLRTRGQVLQASLYSSPDVLPYSYFTEATLPVTATKKNITTTLPPHSAAIIKVKK
ncbi:MAG: hypothetical protein K5945_06245 [Bacteroidaceae bacterium]|nr:hypothetical protein [Bacteroidaceae bacterium]